MEELHALPVELNEKQDIYSNIFRHKEAAFPERCPQTT